MVRPLKRCCQLLVAVVVVHGCGGARGTIGARLGRDGEGHVVLREVPAELGAGRSGLLPGDEVLLIDGQDVRELSTAKLHAVLSGDLGSRVNLTVRRGDEVVRVTVGRTAIPAKVAPR